MAFGIDFVREIKVRDILANALITYVDYVCKFVLLMPLAETIKEFVSFILKGVDLLDHTSIFLLRTINHRVIPIIRIRISIRIIGITR